MARDSQATTTDPRAAMLTPRAILFDLGGTLLRQEWFRPEAWLEALPGVDPECAGPLLRQLIREFRAPSKRGIVEVRMEACLRHLHERLGVRLPLAPPEVELAFWRATCRMAPEPGVAALLAQL